MKKIRICTTNGAAFDLDAPPDFTMATFVQGIRGAGYYLSPDLYIPHDRILFIGIVAMGTLEAADIHMPQGRA